MPTIFPYSNPLTNNVTVNAAMLWAAFGTPINDLAGQSPGSVYWVSRTTTLGLAANTPTPVVTYDGPSYSNGNITFAAGIFTVTQTGLYRWDGTVHWPQVAGGYQMYVYLNGVASAAGRNDGALSTAHTQFVTAGGPQPMNAGDTLQFVLGSPDTALTMAAGITFAVERTG